MRFVIFENYKVKLASLAIAGVFWFFIVTENQYQYAFEVRVVAVNVPEDKILITELPPKALVRFAGKGKSLLWLRMQNDAKIELDLSDVGSGAMIPFEDEMLRIPRRSQKINDWHILEPDSVFIEMAPLKRKTVPILSRIEVIPEHGYTIVNGIQLVPDSITISGPAKTVDQVKAIPTDSLRFTGEKMRFSGKVGLQGFDRGLKILFPFRQINFFVDVQKILENQIEGVPVEVRNAPRNWKVTALPSTINLTVAGGERKLMELSRDSIHVYINYTRTPGRSGGYAPVIEVPRDVEILGYHPKTFKLVREKNN